MDGDVGPDERVVERCDRSLLEPLLERVEKELSGKEKKKVDDSYWVSTKGGRKKEAEREGREAHEHPYAYFCHLFSSSPKINETPSLNCPLL